VQVDLEEIARRAARRAFADRGLELPVQTTPGVHVALLEPRQAPAERRAGSELVTAACLDATPDGGTYDVPDGAVVTPLAVDEAHRRGIRLSRARRGSLRVAVGCDHGGFALKEDVLASVRELGHRALDLGTRDTNAVDYPDYAQAVAEAVAAGQCDFGICIDGAGIGSAIAANKVPGVRAATCNDTRLAANAREHNYANVLALGSGFVSAAEAHEVVRTFLTTARGPERHARRVAKIDAIEQRYSSSPTANRANV
jgi:ribose 5-phosphate isomerase B